MTTAMRMRRVLLPATVAVLLPLAAGAMDADSGTLEEVEIIGQKLWQLREQMIETEQRFYALYNELNTDDDFDVHCEWKAPTGKRIRERLCRARYLMDAQTDEATAWKDGYSAPVATSVGLTRQDEYARTMLAVLNRSPELRRLVREREELERRYRKAHKDRLGSRAVLSE